MSRSRRSATRSAGLIALTGGPCRPARHAPCATGRSTSPRRGSSGLAAAFGDRLYVELQRHGLDTESAGRAAPARPRLSPRPADRRHQRVYFAARSDYESHDALLAIAEGRILAEDDRRRVTPQHYFKTPRGDGSPVRRPARRRSTRRSRSPGAAPSASRTRKPILPRFEAGAGRGGEPVDEAVELRRQAEEGLERAPRRTWAGGRTSDARTTRSGSISSCRSSSG